MPKKSKISNSEVGFFDPGAVAAERQACLRWLRETHLDRAAWKSFEIGLLWMLARIDIPLGTSFVQSQLEAETSIDDLWGEVHGNVGGKARSHRMTWWGDWVAATKRVDAAIHAGNLAASDKTWVAVADALRWLRHEGLDLPPEWTDDSTTVWRVRETTFGAEPRDATPAERAAWHASTAIKHVLNDLPCPQWFEDAREDRPAAFQFYILEREGEPKPAPATDPYGRVMQRTRSTMDALRYAVDCLRAVPAALRGEPLASAETALDDLAGLRLEAGWRQANGNYEAWAKAACPWFAQFERDHAAPLRRASKRLEDLLRDSEAFRAIEAVPPPTLPSDSTAQEPPPGYIRHFLAAERIVTQMDGTKKLSYAKKLLTEAHQQNRIPTWRPPGKTHLYLEQNGVDALILNLRNRAIEGE